jgi:hypothetical protein
MKLILEEADHATYLKFAQVGLNAAHDLLRVRSTKDEHKSLNVREVQADKGLRIALALVQVDKSGLDLSEILRRGERINLVERPRLSCGMVFSRRLNFGHTTEIQHGSVFERQLTLVETFDFRIDSLQFDFLQAALVLVLIKFNVVQVKSISRSRQVTRNFLADSLVLSAVAVQIESTGNEEVCRKHRVVVQEPDLQLSRSVRFGNLNDLPGL